MRWIRWIALAGWVGWLAALILSPVSYTATYNSGDEYTSTCGFSSWVSDPSQPADATDVQCLLLIQNRWNMIFLLLIVGALIIIVDRISAHGRALIYNGGSLVRPRTAFVASDSQLGTSVSPEARAVLARNGYVSWSQLDMATISGIGASGGLTPEIEAELREHIKNGYRG